MTGTEGSAAKAGKKAVLALHRAGELEKARAAYQVLLDASPDDGDVLGLLGVLAMQQQRFDEAQALLSRSLKALDADPRIRLRNLNNLLALLARLGQAQEARTLAGSEFPDWPKATPPDVSERATILSLAEGLASLDRAERALALLESALPHCGDDAAVLTLAGALRLRCGGEQEALPVLQCAVERDPESWRALANLSIAQETLGAHAAAREAMRRCARAASVYCAPEHPDHCATILVLNPAPRMPPKAERGLHALHFSRNYIAQASRVFAREFRFASVFADLPGPIRDLPPADLVFNNIAAGEALGVPGVMDRVVDVIARTGRPVINPPLAVTRMTRQGAAALLQGTPGLRVPRIERYWRDMARFAEIACDIEGKFDYPVIVRMVDADETSNSLLSEKKTSLLVRDRAHLHQFLGSVAWPQFYAIEYVNLRKADGNFRKMRAVFFPDDIFVITCGFYSEWMVTGWRRNDAGHAFYSAFPGRIEDMMRTLRDPEAELGSDFMRVLEAMRDRVPLDTFGLDFDIDDDGQVVFFEGQSSMIYLMPRANVPAHLQLPLELDDRVNNAFRRLVLSRIDEARVPGEATAVAGPPA